MGSDVVQPMSLMARACYDVLCRELVPLHYRKLTELALAELEIDPGKINLRRQVEDVREKILGAGQMNMFYTGESLGCLGGLRRWFDDAQKRLFHPTAGIRIRGDIRSGIEGGFEAVKRYPFMIQKNQRAFEDNRIRACLGGLILQRHVTDYFAQRWPGVYLPACNDDKWMVPCDHDFRVRLNREYKVDVMGPHRDGHFGNGKDGNGRNEKHAVDYHLVCDFDGPDVLWRSVLNRTQLAAHVNPDTDGTPAEWLAVWLSCVRDEIPYGRIRALFGQDALAQAA
jgi:hypothetical protein